MFCDPRKEDREFKFLNSNFDFRTKSLSLIPFIVISMITILVFFFFKMRTNIIIMLAALYYAFYNVNIVF